MDLDRLVVCRSSKGLDLGTGLGEVQLEVGSEHGGVALEVLH